MKTFPSIKNFFIYLLVVFVLMFFSFVSEVSAELRTDGTFYLYENVSGSLWGVPTLDDSDCVFSGSSCIREIWVDYLYDENTIFSSSTAETIPALDGYYIYLFYENSTTTDNYIGWSSFTVLNSDVYPDTFGNSFMSTTTGIGWFTSPDWYVDDYSQDYATTSPVTWTAPYFVSPFDSAILESICLSVTKVDLYSTTQDYCSPITSSGSFVFSTTTVLQNNYVYRYYLYFYDDENIVLNPDTIFYFQNRTPSGTIQIGTVLNSGILPPRFIPSLDDENATTTIREKGSGFVQEAIAVISSKFPFNWVNGFFSDIGIVVQSEDSIATSTFSAVTLDIMPYMSVLNKHLPNATSSMATSGIATKWDLFSTTTLHTVAGMPWVATARTLSTFVLWFSFIGLVLRKAMEIFNNKETQ